VTIRFLSVARQELDDAFAWYERQSAGLGYEFLDELDRVVRRVSVYPDSCAELTHGLRRALLSRFPYGLVYGRETDLIVIVAVAHLHREPRYWMDRLASEGEEQGGEFRASDKPPTKPARRRSRSRKS
jgi:plasmid stabilization system protein ParE